MTTSLDVAVELARGELLLAGLVVPISAAGAGGELRVGGDRGPVLRPLRFGERTRLATFAARCADPRGSLSESVARAATISDGELDQPLRELAALLLCGANQPGPAFSATTLAVARAAGWELGSIVDAEASVVDRLAIAAGADACESGWQRLVFGVTERGQALAALRDTWADTLLARVDADMDAASAIRDAAALEATETEPAARAEPVSRADQPSRVAPLVAADKRQTSAEGLAAVSGERPGVARAGGHAPAPTALANFATKPRPALDAPIISARIPLAAAHSPRVVQLDAVAPARARSEHAAPSATSQPLRHVDPTPTPATPFDPHSLRASLSIAAMPPSTRGLPTRDLHELPAQSAASAADLADALAQLLDEEAELRGIA
jgi:hypothetical protein